MAYADDSYLLAEDREGAQKLVDRLGALAIGEDAYAPDLRFKHSDSTLVVFGKLGSDAWDEPLLLGGRPNAEGDMVGGLPIPEATTIKIVGLVYSQTLGERRARKWLNQDGRLKDTAHCGPHPLGPEPRNLRLNTNDGNSSDYPCSSLHIDTGDELLGTQFTRADATFTLQRVYFDTDRRRTMASLNVEYSDGHIPRATPDINEVDFDPDDGRPPAITIPWEEAYYALTRSKETDPWLHQTTAAIEKAARLTSWQVSRANHGGVNGVWRNPLDALLLVEQLALHGALYGSPVIHPGHKRLAPLKSTSLLHRLISKARHRVTGTTSRSMNDAAWCCEFGRLMPTDLLHSRSLRFFQRLLTLPDHCQSRRILIGQLRRGAQRGDAGAHLPVHLHPAARTMLELDSRHGAGLTETFILNTDDNSLRLNENWSLAQHEQRLIEAAKRFQQVTAGSVRLPPLQTSNKYRLYTQLSRPEYDRLRSSYARWLRAKLQKTHADKWFSLLSVRYADNLSSVHRSNGPQFNFSAGSRDNTAPWLKASSRHKLTPAYSRGVTFKLRLRVGGAFELPSHAGHQKPTSDTQRFQCKCSLLSAPDNWRLPPPLRLPGTPAPGTSLMI